MIPKIESDRARFNQILKGKVREELKKYIQAGEMLGRVGGKYVKIPIPSIDLPKIRYGLEQTGGVSSGEGEEGANLGPASKEEAENGEGKAGNETAEHQVEVNVSLNELAEILGEELELPNIKPKGSDKIKSKKIVYKGVHLNGPRSLVHFKRTYKEALKRQISAGEYNPDDPRILPVKKDFRFRGWKEEIKYQNNALIIYMMDVSGSMGEDQKEIVRLESFWIDTWLRSQYEGIETRYIIHDAAAKIVDKDTFFTTKESGGTLISSAYKLCLDLINKEFSPVSWNIYPFHFSDGDNWSGEDTKICINLLKEKILPISNMFCYGQVESKYGSGQFLKDLQANFSNSDDLVLSEIPDKKSILKSIKEFLGKGK